MPLPQIFYHEDALTWLIALAALLLIVVFSRHLSALIIRLTLSRLRARKRDHYLLVKKALRHPIAWMVIFGSARIMASLLSISNRFTGTIYNIFGSLFMVMAIWALYAAAGLVAASLVESSGERKMPVNPMAANLIGGAVRIAVLAIGLILVLARWIPDISGLIAGLGIGGLAIALAAQDTAANFIGSIAIMMDKPFELGDWVEVDGISGTVERIGLRSSRVRAIDQSLVSIPNARMANANIINGAHRAFRRIAYRIALTPETDPALLVSLVDKAKQILADDQDINKDSILVTFDAFTPYSLELSVIYHTVTDFRQMMKVKERNNFALLAAMKSLDIHCAAPSVSAPSNL